MAAAGSSFAAVPSAAAQAPAKTPTQAPAKTPPTTAPAGLRAPGPAATSVGSWALTHVDVHPLANGGKALRDATVVVEGGVVRCVGACALPAGIDAHDLGGATLLPGFVASASALGQMDVAMEAASHDGAVAGVDNAAHVRARDGLSLRSRVVDAARWGGVVAAVVKPLGDALVSGTSCAFRTAVPSGGGAGDAAAILSDAVGVHVHLGEDGKRAAARPLVGARSGQIALLRALLHAARLAAPVDARGLAGATDALALAALAPVLKGRLPLVVHAHRAADIAAALRLREEFGLRMIVVGGAEAWRLAPTLAAAGVPVVLAPTRAWPFTFETAGARDDAVLILHRAGVTLALATGSTHNARNLRWHAGWAVAQGLPRDVALAAISTTPARIFGVDGAVGVQVGAAPGFVVVRGDALDLDGVIAAVAVGDRLELAPQQR